MALSVLSALMLQNVLQRVRTEGDKKGGRVVLCCCLLQATTASDLYSLGATLLYLVSGQPPGAFPQKRMRIAYK